MTIRDIGQNFVGPAYDSKYPQRRKRPGFTVELLAVSDKAMLFQQFREPTFLEQSSLEVAKTNAIARSLYFKHG